MKKLYKFLLVSLMVSSVGFYSCETVELENLTDPNELAPDQADPNLLLNSIQLAYKDNETAFNNLGSQVARIDYMFGRNYVENFDGATLNAVWTRFYSNNNVFGMVENAKAIAAINDASPDVDLSFHVSVANIMVAHNMMQLVDWLGDIPWTEANDAANFPNPSVDDDADVYAAANALLDNAIAALGSSSGAGSATDFFYGGDVSKWIKLANTIKMRSNLTTGNYTAVVNATNVISSEDDDFQFNYGTNALTPDTRHPDYITDYRDDGAGIYKSNWLMNLMAGSFGDVGADTPDPRRRYYFYRQNWRTPGNFALFQDVLGAFGPPGDIYISNGAPNGETLSCSLQDAPPHLQFTPDEEYWCSNKLGYWGRLHGNDEGTPPDTFARTASGVYPAGGSFDGVADAFPFVGDFPDLGQQVGLGKGGGGAGIEPIYLASYVDFMKAQAAMALGNTTQAASFFEAGITKSIAKVQGFAALDPDADLSQVPTATTVAAFIAEKVAEFNGAATTTALDGNGYPVAKDKMDILGEQYFVAMYGGGADAFNFIRIEGYPRTLARNIEPASGVGTFPRTILYPNNEIIANPNITQRTDLNTLVFWDAGVTNPAN